MLIALTMKPRSSIHRPVPAGDFPYWLYAASSTAGVTVPAMAAWLRGLGWTGKSEPGVKRGRKWIGSEVTR